MENIVVIGMKHSGKSTLAKQIANHFKMNLITIDELIENTNKKNNGKTINTREIYKTYGANYFRKLESIAIKNLARSKVSNAIIDCGGGAPITTLNQKYLKSLGKIVFIKLNPEVNLKRILSRGIPSFFKYPDDPKKSFYEIYSQRIPVYTKLADIIIEVTNENPKEVFKKFTNVISNEAIA